MAYKSYDFTKLKNFMDNLAKTSSPGNVAEVYLDGKEVFKYASGYSNVEENRVMTGNEMFNIYSCSKITTVTAALQLLEKGIILLNDPLSDSIPEFRHMYVENPDGSIVEATSPITVGDLFSMTAGFTYNLQSEGFKKAADITSGKMDTLTAIRCVASDPLSFNPGEKWQYSICHDVLAGLVCAVTGKKFRDYVKENIFEPLDMQSCVYHHTKETLEKTPPQYYFEEENAGEFDAVESQKLGRSKQGTFRNVGKKVSFVLGEEYDSGGAGIVSTVSDYSKLIVALANYGMGLNGERVLAPQTVELLRTNRLTKEQYKSFDWPHYQGYGYGLGVGVHVNPVESGVNCTVGSFGWGGAAGASVIIDPERKLAVFHVQHTLNPREGMFQPRLKNVVYACIL